MPGRKSTESIPSSLLEAFSILPDPRSSRSRRHPLTTIVAIAVCGVIAGADNWVAIEMWAKGKEEWLASFLDMSEGVPSHDTFGRVFSILSPDAFQAAFIEWASSLAVDQEGRVIAIDGKTLRRSHDRGRGKSPIHIVNAWRSDVGLAIGQRATDDKSNEITAVPELLEQLYLKGAIVTLDAMGCQREIASTIRRKEGDYLLAVKGNQPTVRDAVASAFEAAFSADEPPAALHACTDADRGHGRHVERTAWVLPAPSSLRADDRWPDLSSIVLVDVVRRQDGRETTERRMYISSLAPTSARELARAIRSHWGVENGLHWVLDVAFREDDARIRIGHAAENMSRIRQIALNLLKQDKTLKVGIKTKRLRAAGDERYMLRVLGATEQGERA